MPSASSRLVGLSPVRAKLRLSALRVDEARRERTGSATESQALEEKSRRPLAGCISEKKGRGGADF